MRVAKLPILSAAALAAILLAPAARAAAVDVEAANAAGFTAEPPTTGEPDPFWLKVQVLLDRAGFSPGVIDGRHGGNVDKALRAFEEARGLAVDGRLDEEAWRALGGDEAGPVLVEREVSAEDAGTDFVGEVPEDYAEMAELEHVGYGSMAEMLAERHHMDIDLFRALNEGRDLVEGGSFVAADVGAPLEDVALARLVADTSDGQLRGFDEAGKLLFAYPATIGSEDNPSLSGTHTVELVVREANYTYRPDVNFQQGDNTDALVIAPGPNNPVGGIWIDLSEDTYGIHGTAEPNSIGKTASHGCVRLTNWDARELAELVEEGMPVEFVD